MAKNRVEEIRKAKGMSVSGCIERAAIFGHRLDGTRFYRIRVNQLQPDLEEAHLFVKVFELESTQELITE